MKRQWLHKQECFPHQQSLLSAFSKGEWLPGGVFWCFLSIYSLWTKPLRKELMLLSSLKSISVLPLIWWEWAKYYEQWRSSWTVENTWPFVYMLFLLNGNLSAREDTAINHWIGVLLFWKYLTIQIIKLSKLGINYLAHSHSEDL